MAIFFQIAEALTTQPLLVRKTCYLYGTLFFFILFALPLAADETTRRLAFESELQGILDKGRGRAISGVVVRDGRVQWQGALGMANVDSHTAATAQTVFQLASAGKILTGLALCDLAVSGKLSLDDQVMTLAPELAINNAFAEDPIRVRHLLEHTSGIQETIPRWYDERFEPALPMIELIRKTLGTVEVIWRPGERTVYSNFNYVVANYLIEKLTGMKFDDYFATTFFRPMGMTSATFRLYADPPPTAARGYMGESTEALAYTVGIYRVAAGMAASAEDVGKMILMMINNGVYREKQIVAHEALRLMEKITTGPAGRFGLPLGHGSGVVAREMHNRKFFGHNGIVDGFVASLFYSREDNFGFALMTNAHPLPQAPSLSKARDAIMRHFLPQARLAAEWTATPSGEPLSKYVGFYQYASARFAQLSGFDRLWKSVWITERRGRLYEHDLFGERRELIETSPHLFRHADDAFAAVVLERTESRAAFMFRAPNSFYTQTAPYAFWITVLVLACSAMAVASVPPYLVMMLCTRRRMRSVDILLGLTIVSVLAVTANLYMLRTSETALTLNIVTGSLYVMTLLLYLSGTSACILSMGLVMRRRDLQTWYQVVTACGAGAWVNYLLYYGLIGIKFWDRASSLLK